MANYKVLQNDYKMGQLLRITKWDRYCCKVGQLQNYKIGQDNNKVRQNNYKVGQLLQSRAKITKKGIKNKIFPPKTTVSTVPKKTW